MDNKGPVSVNLFMNYENLGRLNLPTYETPIIRAGGLFVQEHDFSLPRDGCFAKLKEVRDCILTWKNKNEPITVSDILGIIVFGSSVRLPESKTQIVRRGSTISYKAKVVEKNPSDIDLMVITKGKYNGEKNIVRSRSIDPSLGVEQLCTGNLPVSIDNRSTKQLLNGIKDGDDTIATNCIKEGIVIVSSPDLLSLINSTGIKQTSPYDCYHGIIDTGIFKKKSLLDIDVR